MEELMLSYHHHHHDRQRPIRVCFSHLASKVAIIQALFTTLFFSLFVCLIDQTAHCQMQPPQHCAGLTELRSAEGRRQGHRCMRWIQQRHRDLQTWHDQANRALNSLEHIAEYTTARQTTASALAPVAQELHRMRIQTLADWAQQTLTGGIPTLEELRSGSNEIQNLERLMAHAIQVYNSNAPRRSAALATGAALSGAAAGFAASGGPFNPATPFVAGVSGVYAAGLIFAQGLDGRWLAPGPTALPPDSTPAPSMAQRPETPTRPVFETSTPGEEHHSETSPTSSSAPHYPEALYPLSNESPEQYRARLTAILEQQRESQKQTRRLLRPLSRERKLRLLQQILYDWHRLGDFPDHRVSDWTRLLLQLQTPNEYTNDLSRWEGWRDRLQAEAQNPQLPFDTRIQELAHWFETQTLAVPAHRRTPSTQESLAVNRHWSTAIASTSQCLNRVQHSARCLTDLLISALDSLHMTGSEERLAVEITSHQIPIPVLFFPETKQVIRLSAALSTLEGRGDIYEPAYLAYQAIVDLGETRTAVPREQLLLLSAQDRTPQIRESALRTNSSTPSATALPAPFTVRPRDELESSFQTLIQSWNQRQRSGDFTPPPLDERSGLVRLELEAYAYSQPQPQDPALLAQLTRAWETWISIREEARAALGRLQATPSPQRDTLEALLRIHEVRSVIVRRVAFHYNRDEAGILSALQGTGINCQGNSRLLLAALVELGVAPPPGEQYALQMLPMHIQLVSYHQDRNQIRNLMESNSPEPFEKGDLYRAALEPRSVAGAMGFRSVINHRDLLIRSQSRTGLLDTLAGLLQMLLRRQSQFWSQVSHALDLPTPPLPSPGDTEQEIPRFSRIREPARPQAEDATSVQVSVPSLQRQGTPSNHRTIDAGGDAGSARGDGGNENQSGVERDGDNHGLGGGERDGGSQRLGGGERSGERSGERDGGTHGLGGGERDGGPTNSGPRVHLNPGTGSGSRLQADGGLGSPRDSTDRDPETHEDPAPGATLEGSSSQEATENQTQARQEFPSEFDAAPPRVKQRLREFSRILVGMLSRPDPGFQYALLPGYCWMALGGADGTPSTITRGYEGIQIELGLRVSRDVPDSLASPLASLPPSFFQRCAYGPLSPLDIYSEIKRLGIGHRPELMRDGGDLPFIWFNPRYAAAMLPLLHQGQSRMPPFLQSLIRQRQVYEQSLSRLPLPLYQLAVFPRYFSVLPFLTDEDLGVRTYKRLLLEIIQLGNRATLVDRIPSPSRNQRRRRSRAPTPLPNPTIVTMGPIAPSRPPLLIDMEFSNPPSSTSSQAHSSNQAAPLNHLPSAATQQDRPRIPVSQQFVQALLSRNATIYNPVHHRSNEANHYVGEAIIHLEQWLRRGGLSASIKNSIALHHLISSYGIGSGWPFHVHWDEACGRTTPALRLQFARYLNHESGEDDNFSFPVIQVCAASFSGQISPSTNRSAALTAWINQARRNTIFWNQNDLNPDYNEARSIRIVECSTTPNGFRCE